MSFQHIQVPPDGSSIVMKDGRLQVPDRPIIPFIEGDGTGPDIWRSAVRVLEAAVARAYGGRRRLVWMEVFAGGKCHERFGTWLLDETVEAFQRLQAPEPVAGWTVIVVAAIGVLINGITAALFMAGSKDDLNIRGAFLHMAGDALVSLGVVAAGVLKAFSKETTRAWSWISGSSATREASACICSS